MALKYPISLEVAAGELRRQAENGGYVALRKTKIK
jgi:hypothetical protein